MSAAQIPCCPDHDAQAAFAELPAPLRVWLYPMRDQLHLAAHSATKPIGQITVPEAVAWATLIGYAYLSGAVLARVSLNLTAVALRGPVVRR